MSFYSASEKKYGSFDEFVQDGIVDSEKQALNEKYPEADKQQAVEDSGKNESSGGNAESIANMERNDYLTLLSEQMNM